MAAVAAVGVETSIDHKLSGIDAAAQTVKHTAHFQADLIFAWRKVSDRVYAELGTSTSHEGERIAARTAGQDIAASVARDKVIAITTIDSIVVFTAVQAVVATATADNILVLAAIDCIVPRSAEYGVVASVARNQVIVLTAVYQVITFTGKDDIVATAASDQYPHPNQKRWYRCRRRRRHCHSRRPIESGRCHCHQR